MGWGFLDDAVEGGIDLRHLGEQLFEDLPAVGREPIKAFLAIVLFAPLAREKTLRLEPAEKRVERAFIDLESEIAQVFAEGVAVMLAPQLGENGDDEQAAAELEADVFEEIGIHFGFTVCQTLCDTQCVQNSSGRQHFFSFQSRAALLTFSFEKAGGFDEQYFAGEEMYLPLALRKRGRFVVLKESVTTSARKVRMRATATSGTPRLILLLGVAMTVAFVLIRALNVYGDPQRWSPQIARRCLHAAVVFKSGKIPALADLSADDVGSGADCARAV